MIRETLTLLLDTHPLLLALRALSVLCVAIVLDRLLFWISSALRYRPLPPGIYDMSEPARDVVTRQLQRTRHQHYTREILLACLECPGCSDRIGQTVAEVVDRMSSRLTALEMIAKIAPLLGILGTVVGMILSFSGISIGSLDSATAVSQGIGVALKTTADGLVVSIVASIACAGFRQCIHRAMLKMGRIICEAQYIANVDNPGLGAGLRGQPLGDGGFDAAAGHDLPDHFSTADIAAQ